MAHDNIISEVKEKLKVGGYGGLFYPGECACTLDEFAPCGEREREDDEEYINNCEPGYVFRDPRPGAPIGCVTKRENKEPTLKEWRQYDNAI